MFTHEKRPDQKWWASAVIYQVYPRSFADSNGDGIGDLPGITSRLPYLQQLGVDAVWISPFYPSPQADAGYDVADYLDVDPLFGELADVDVLIERAHDLGLRVIIDLVPNHTSAAHPWFQRALAAGPGSPAREWYVFRDANLDDPDRPPNNWPSEFGGDAWSRTADGQWYLHLFDASQPDLNWQHPGVRAAFIDILRFWLDRGVDGFRVDVAHGLVKAQGLPNSPLDRTAMQAPDVATNTAPYWDQDEVHEIYREWRQVLDEYPGDRVMVAEAWVRPPSRLARYVRPDEHHQAFNFTFLDTRWRATEIRQRLLDSLHAGDAVGAPTTWVLSNHDVIRHATRFALDPQHFTVQLAQAVPTPDAALGIRRARAATTLMLALPGSAYLYQGEELGLPEVLDLAPDQRQDPTFHRTGGARLGRDGCRVPIPWQADARHFGFGSGAEPWLPQPRVFATHAVSALDGVPGSTLELYRALLSTRRTRALGTGSLTMVDLGQDIVAFDIENARGTTRVVLNLGEPDWKLPEGARVVIASEDLVTDCVPRDCAVWLDLE